MGLRDGREGIGHGLMLDPVRHGFILERHLAKGRDVVSVC